MKLIYSELIEKVSYKKINCVVDFEYARKGVNEILSGLKFDDLKNLRLYTYQQRISKTKFKELSFSTSHFNYSWYFNRLFAKIFFEF